MIIIINIVCRRVSNTMRKTFPPKSFWFFCCLLAVFKPHVLTSIDQSIEYCQHNFDIFFVLFIPIQCNSHIQDNSHISVYIYFHLNSINLFISVRVHIYRSTSDVSPSNAIFMRPIPTSLNVCAWTMAQLLCDANHMRFLWQFKHEHIGTLHTKRIVCV